MTRITAGAIGALLATTSIAAAGALDRSGQPVSAIFETGNYAELSFGRSMPTVEGTSVTGAASGDVGADYSLFGMAFKYDVREDFSLALIIDQPFGSDVDYTGAEPGYPIGGTTAEFNSVAVTALGRYRFGNGFSVHGGVRAISVDADLLVSAFVPNPFPPPAPPAIPVSYEGDFDSDTGYGYVVGVAYERPDIALRVALTYASAVEMSHDTTYTFTTPLGPAPGTGVTEYELPQSVNLEFRTGIAQGTAVFGSVRWVDWSEVVINAPGFDPLGNPVVSYPNDYVTYTLGVGRQFSDRLTGTAAVIYEPAADDDGIVSDLSPYDGQLGLALAATYKVTDAIEVTGLVRYTRLGDAETGIGAVFDDSDLIGVGLRVGYRF